MKHLFFGLLATSGLLLTACNNNSEKKAENNEHSAHEKMDSTATNTNAAASVQSADFTELFSHYQHLTVALASDDDKEAANAAKGMLETLPKIKTEALTAEQKKNYGDIQADIKENAEHIAENVGNIDHQREHLAVLSKDFYDIKKSIGTEEELYKVFCPMYDNKKGAFWLSKNKEVKNPYYGKKMLSCGTVQEELK
ncbi:DUF3347 domain-containing protein [Chryseobacterium timonianum]|uniref:DUF3347 domain-containing protein n=1 Tax=Chryseobacterium timonianum TaxID=1805473 RepID=UPI001F4AC04C|nr:DUF3347 domain-containing protein [Chryseobacterium timonianum]